jgi:hypothetical protein
LIAKQLSVRVPGEPGRPTEVSLLDHVLLVGQGQLFEGELTERFEQPVAGTAGRQIDE